MTDEKSESEITAADVNPGEDREVADGRAAPHYDPLPPKSVCCYLCLSFNPPAHYSRGLADQQASVSL